jgi:23S rRNA (uracil1939-C5)-methyltransferase
MQTEELYRKAIEYADLSPNDIVIDAYCGIGTIGLSVAKHCKTVLGVEVVKTAIDDAIENAKINQITNAKFVAGKAEDVIKSWSNYNVNALFIDPPRKGCAKSFLDTIIEMKIPKIVYVSCNVATLARDLNVLQAAGYDVREVTPFDMFPQTSHIEAVVMLRLNRQSE